MQLYLHQQKGAMVPDLSRSLPLCPKETRVLMVLLHLKDPLLPICCIRIGKMAVDPKRVMIAIETWKIHPTCPLVMKWKSRTKGKYISCMFQRGWVHGMTLAFPRMPTSKPSMQTTARVSTTLWVRCQRDGSDEKRVRGDLIFSITTAAQHSSPTHDFIIMPICVYSCQSAITRAQILKAQARHRLHQQYRQTYPPPQRRLHLK